MSEGTFSEVPVYFVLNLKTSLLPVSFEKKYWMGSKSGSTLFTQTCFFFPRILWVNTVTLILCSLICIRIEKSLGLIPAET